MSSTQLDEGGAADPQPSLRVPPPRRAGRRMRAFLCVGLFALGCAPAVVHGQTAFDLLRRVQEANAESSSAPDSSPEPSTADSRELSGVSVEADVILDTVWAEGRDSRPIQSIEVDLTRVDEGRMDVRDELVSLTLFRRPVFSPGGTGVALPWSEARALLGQVLAHSSQMFETLASILHAVETDGGTLYVP